MKKKCLFLMVLTFVILSIITMFHITAIAATGGNCGVDVTWELSDDGILTISGTGDMELYDLPSVPPPWNDIKESVKSIIVTDGVTSISSDAFSGCANLTDVTIGGTVAKIGAAAFEECSQLVDVNIIDGLISIGMGAFRYCVSLKEIIIPSTVTKIDDNVFSGCDILTDISVDPNNKNYSSVDGNLYNKDKTVFINCAPGKSDTNLIIPDSVKKIGYASFE